MTRRRWIVSVYAYDDIWTFCKLSRGLPEFASCLLALQHIYEKKTLNALTKQTTVVVNIMFTASNAIFYQFSFYVGWGLWCTVVLLSQNDYSNYCETVNSDALSMSSLAHYSRSSYLPTFLVYIPVRIGGARFRTQVWIGPLSKKAFYVSFRPVPSGSSFIQNVASW